MRPIVLVTGTSSSWAQQCMAPSQGCSRHQSAACYDGQPCLTQCSPLACESLQCCVDIPRQPEAHLLQCMVLSYVALMPCALQAGILALAYDIPSCNTELFNPEVSATLSNLGRGAYPHQACMMGRGDLSELPAGEPRYRSTRSAHPPCMHDGLCGCRPGQLQ